MRMLISDFRRGFRNLWFTISVLAVLACLWLDLGTDSYWLLRGETVDPLELFSKALTGTGSALSLPLLSSLPCAASAFQDLSSGAARMAIFRCGRTSFVAGKLVSLLVLTAISQALGALLFAGLLIALCPVASASFPTSIVLARSLSAMLFAAIGGTGELLAGDSVSAYAIPTALSFALTMLSTRFFVGVLYVDPLSWLSGNTNVILLLILLVAASSTLYATLLHSEIKRYV